jgi:hypothetical protein
VINELDGEEEDVNNFRRSLKKIEEIKEAQNQ